MKRRTSTALPPLTEIHRRDTHRLISARFGAAQDPLQDLAETPPELRDLIDLSSATDEILLTESGLLPAISPHELASGAPQARIVNAAFIYAHPAGSRFNSADRGAWYAAFQLSGAQAEALAEKLLENGSSGVIYPSVRRARRTGLACFDPTAVRNVRRGQRFRFIWRGKPIPRIHPLAVRHRPSRSVFDQ